MAKQKGAEAPHKPLMVDAASMTEPVRELQPPDPDWRATLLHVFALCAVQVGINVAIMVFIYTGDEVTEHVYVLAALWMMFIYSVLLPISILRFVFIVKDHKVLRIFLRGLLTVVDMLSVPLLASLARMAAKNETPSIESCGLAIAAVLIASLGVSGVMWTSARFRPGTAARRCGVGVSVFICLLSVVLLGAGVFALRGEQTPVDILFPGHELRDHVDEMVLTEAVLDHVMAIASVAHRVHRCRQPKASRVPYTRHVNAAV